MNCDQSASYDEELVAKDAEIAELNRKLSTASSAHGDDDHVVAAAAYDSLHHHSPTTSGSSVLRRGKAPPVDPFACDDGTARFD